jgi:hypothetical protein
MTPVLLIVALLIIGGLYYGVVGGGRGSGGPSAGSTLAPTAQPSPAKELVGTFIRWEPVDEANGYAYIEVKNNGTTTATAECTVRVGNDFGNFGFDFMVGEEIPPGETFSGRMALSVGEGSFLINEGEVTDC